jgi:hypothetical protein
MSFTGRKGRSSQHASTYFAPPPHRSWTRLEGNERASLTPTQSQALQQRLWAVMDGE